MSDQPANRPPHARHARSAAERAAVRLREVHGARQATAEVEAARKAAQSQPDGKEGS